MRRGMRSFRSRVCSGYNFMFVLLKDFRKSFSKRKNEGTRCRNREMQCYPAWPKGRESERDSRRSGVCHAESA